MPKKDITSLGKFYGSTTVGIHGQVVIPAEVRRQLGIGTGSKLLVFVPVNHQMLGLLKAEALQQLVSLLTSRLGQIGELAKQLSSDRKARPGRSKARK